MLAVVAGLAVTVVMNFRGGGPEEVLDSLPKNVDLALKQINYTETSNGIRRWSMIADSAAHSVQGGITRIGNPRMTFYGGDGVMSGTLSAAGGQINSENRTVRAEGNVVITNRGYTFFTEHLLYRDADRVITTEDPVRLDSTDMEVQGRGLRLDLENHTFELHDDVKATIRPGRPS
jgi:LPS export ABC transporter protein LptC